MSTYVKRKSDRQEKRTAKEFGGRTQIASGAIPGMKGDVRTGERNANKLNDNDFLIENKYTEAPSYKLTLATWDKIAKEALRDNFRTPLMQIDIQELEIVVMDEGTFKSQMPYEHKVDCVIKAGGKTATINKIDCEVFFELSDVITINFHNVSKVLYVVRKEDFLRNLP